MGASDANLRTTMLIDVVERFRNGDADAGDFLGRQLAARLRQLAEQLLRSFPQVRAHAAPEDLAQGAMLRFLKAIREVQFESVRHFHNLAALQLRRELLDLARRCRSLPQAGDLPDEAQAQADLDRWIDLHEALAELDGDERDLVNILFYHGLSQHETAAMLGVSAKTVQRRWQALCVRLFDRLGGRLPQA